MNKRTSLESKPEQFENRLFFAGRNLTIEVILLKLKVKFLEDGFKTTIDWKESSFNQANIQVILEEYQDDFQKQSDNLDLIIKELKENNINIIIHNIDKQLIYTYALEQDNLCIEDITCQHIIKTITLSFTHDMLIEIDKRKNNEFLKYVIDKK